MCARGAKSLTKARRMRSLPIQLCPLDCSITDKVVSSDKPRCSDKAMISAAPTKLMPAKRLLTSLVRAPSPTRVPIRNTWLDKALRSFSWLTKTESSQATIKLIVPASARTGPPDMGASTVKTPWACRRAATVSTKSGAKVGHRKTVSPDCSVDHQDGAPLGSNNWSTCV